MSINPDIADVLAGRRRWCVVTGDCLEILPTMPAGCIDAVVTDPPYGVNAVQRGACFGTSNACSVNAYRPIVGDDRPFDPSPLLSLAPCVVLFGANHFAERLPSRARWLVWDKRDGIASNPLADCELAWTSDSRPARLYHHRWMGMVRDSEPERRVHPSQKPWRLMQWVLDVMDIKPDTLVVDPYCGSGSTGIAAVKAGCRFIGIEIDPEYAEIARRRIAEADTHLFAASDSVVSVPSVVSSSVGGEPC